ncbi:MAG: GGDEF domain-containing protein [Spirochaetales bacterium]|nr:GGDEF domain-containing protein [Spirochaetales bacterium]
MKIFHLYYLDKKSEISPNRSYTLGRNWDNSIILPEKSVSRNHAVLEGRGDSFILRDLGSTNGTFVEGERITEIPLRDNGKFRIGSCNLELVSREADLTPSDALPSDTMLFENRISKLMNDVDDPGIAERIEGLKQFFNNKRESLSLRANKDGLTGLYNRRYMDEKLEEEIERAVRYNRPLSLIMIDIDRFKKFNDAYGHQKGDEVLSTVARILKVTSRNMDILCRYGGEEMAFILPETTPDHALTMADMCRQRICDNVVKEAGVKVTISLGVAGVSERCATAEDLIAAADRALYRAKNNGRNRVEWEET